MIDYNRQVLPLWPWPAVHFSLLILLNLKLNDRRVKWPCTRLCWTAVRDVPLGKGLYSYQTHASLVGMVYRGSLCGVLKWCNVWAHKRSISVSTIDFRPTSTYKSTSADLWQQHLTSFYTVCGVLFAHKKESTVVSVVVRAVTHEMNVCSQSVECF